MDGPRVVERPFSRYVGGGVAHDCVRAVFSDRLLDTFLRPFLGYVTLQELDVCLRVATDLVAFESVHGS